MDPSHHYLFQNPAFAEAPAPQVHSSIMNGLDNTSLYYDPGLDNPGPYEGSVSALHCALQYEFEVRLDWE